MDDFWHKQDPAKPLYPDLLWSRPEQKSQAGKLLIIGGNLHSISTPSSAYNFALKAGVGSCRVALPNSTRKFFGKVHPENIEFVASTPSGSFGAEAYDDITSNISWADAVLFAGDFGKNSETTILLEKLIKINIAQVYCGDSIDHITSNPKTCIESPNCALVLTYRQLQKMAVALGYQAAFLHSDDILQVVNKLHGLSELYPTIFITIHQGNIVCGLGGQISTTKVSGADVGKLASLASVWLLQNLAKPFEAVTTASSQYEHLL